MNLHAPTIIETNVQPCLITSFWSAALCETEFPGILERIERERGKILFLGNGLSDIPLIPAALLSKGILDQPATIVDVFDYMLLKDDIYAVYELLKGNGPIPQNLWYILNKTVFLCNAISLGRLKVIQYCFGTSNIPAELLNSNLVVNLWGPPITTLHEQLALLTVGGELYLKGIETRHLVLSAEFEFTPLAKGVGGIIQRIANS
ncbi:hypothetical protein JW766_01310 [Candidatus Dojkabacteria bacterium]|nr:hypothetical protein [Candidatus Dojkabacteria bacterium]